MQDEWSRILRPSTLNDITDVIHFLKSKVSNFFDGFFYQVPERPPVEA